MIVLTAHFQFVFVRNIILYVYSSIILLYKYTQSYSLTIMHIKCIFLSHTVRCIILMKKKTVLDFFDIRKDHSVATEFQPLRHDKIPTH